MNENVKNSPGEIKPDKVTAIMRQSLLESVSTFGIKGISLNLLGSK